MKCHKTTWLPAVVQAVRFSPIEQRHKSIGCCDHVHQRLQHLLWQLGGALSIISIDTPAPLYAHLQSVSHCTQFLCQTAQIVTPNTVCLHRHKKQYVRCHRYVFKSWSTFNFTRHSKNVAKIVSATVKHPSSVYIEKKRPFILQSVMMMYFHNY